MPSDRSRRTDPVRNGYTGVAAQQGRVILDRDFNALQGLMAERDEAETIDVIGPSGTPDDGFRVSLPAQNGSPPQFYSPPVSPPNSPPIGGPGDLLIAPGTMYLGGQRVVFPPRQNGAPITYSYYDQPDWPSPDAPQQGYSGGELVYLDVTEQEVSAVEDPDLLEVALGGPDTTQRIKLLRRVRRMPVGTGDCTAAWQAAVAQWASQGLQFDPATARLVPQARLQIGFTQDASTGDPCDPVASGGYLGTDNQLIRIRTVNAGGTASLIWGYDNASFLYRVTSVSADHTMLTLASDPPDGFHVPQTGQLVEVLTTSAVLGQVPDETDPTDSTTILRVAASAEGTLTALAQPYGPVTAGDPTNYVVLATALPAAVANSALPLFLRVWQAQLPLPATGGTVTLSDPNTGISTGVTATTVLPSGAALPDGAFWQVAVRPSTPQGVYPEELLISPQPADGPRRWACPLAVIEHRIEGGPKVVDCRNSFVNLVALTRRRPGCCTVGISPSDITASSSLQSLIDNAAGLGDYVTVCLGPGQYPLQQTLRLSWLHENMTIEGCGGYTRLYADEAAEPGQFVDGILAISNASQVTVRGLIINAPLVPMSAALISELTATSANAGAYASQLGAAFVGFGIRVFSAYNLTLEDCEIILQDTRPNFTGDVFGAILHLQGYCFDFTMQGCSLLGISTSFTPLAIDQARVSPVGARTYAAALDRLNQSFAATNSPPTAAAALTLGRSAAAFDAVMAIRSTIARDAVAPSVIATVGVLATEVFIGTGNNQYLENCYLGSATLRDNSIENATIGTWISTISTDLRVQDNIITGGVAGFWLEIPGAGVPSAPVPESPSFFPRCVQFEEFLLTYVFATAFPQPGATASTPAARPAKLQAAAPAAIQNTASVAPQAQTAIAADARQNAVATRAQAQVFEASQDFTLFLTGNKIETIGLSTATAGTWSCSSAVLLLMETQTAANKAIGGNALIMSSNQLRSATGVNAPTALTVLPYAMPSAITGNIVLNTGPSNAAAGAVVVVPSLWVVADGSQNGIQLLSISGNVLNGTSDLTQLPRPGRPVAGGWDSYNANPS